MLFERLMFVFSVSWSICDIKTCSRSVRLHEFSINLRRGWGVIMFIYRQPCIISDDESSFITDCTLILRCLQTMLHFKVWHSYKNRQCFTWLPFECPTLYDWKTCSIPHWAGHFMLMVKLQYKKTYLDFKRSDTKLTVLWRNFSSHHEWIIPDASLKKLWLYHLQCYPAFNM